MLECCLQEKSPNLVPPPLLHSAPQSSQTIVYGPKSWGGPLKVILNLPGSLGPVSNSYHSLSSIVFLLLGLGHSQREIPLPVILDMLAFNLVSC